MQFTFETKDRMPFFGGNDQIVPFSVLSKAVLDSSKLLDFNRLRQVFRIES